MAANSRTLKLEGQRFERLVVVQQGNNSNHGMSKWLCRCDCGAEIIAIGSNLKNGHTKSCGCLAKELRNRRNELNIRNMAVMDGKRVCRVCRQPKTLDCFPKPYRRERGSLRESQSCNACIEKTKKKASVCCTVCSGVFRVRPTEVNVRLYCSHKCHGIGSRVAPVEIDGARVCRTCKQPKALSCFYKPHKYRGELKEHKQCKKCLLLQQDRYRQAHREEIREKHRNDSHNNQLRRYKMSKSDYDIKLTAQGGKCAICGGINPVRRLAVDHDHACCNNQKSCGKCVRGLLCHKCNQGLHFIENKEFLIAAEIYLWQHSKEAAEISVK